MNDMTVCYIGIGSNKGSSPKYLNVTSAMGDESQPDYLNAVIKVDTSLKPKSVLAFLLGLEKALGRVRDPKNQNAARVIDCDLLLFGREQLESDLLTLPHPRMTERLFVMQPLVEVAPKAYIPGSGYAKEVFNRLNEDGVYSSQRVDKVEN